MSGLRSFGGEFRKAQKVSLVGRSRGEETRAEVLERTRRERERRRRERQEQSAATAIQVEWLHVAGWLAGGHGTWLSAEQMGQLVSIDHARHDALLRFTSCTARPPRHG